MRSVATIQCVISVCSCLLLSACVSEQPRVAAAITNHSPAVSVLANTGLQNIVSFDVTVTDNVVHLVVAGTPLDAAQDVAVRYVRSDDGGQHWQTPMAVPTHGHNPMVVRGNDIQIAATGQQLLVMWQAHGALPNFGPLVSTYSNDAGKTWKVGTNPAVNAEGDQSHVALATDSQGGLHAVWLEDPEENGYQSLRYAHATQIGQPWTVARTLDTSTCSCCWNTVFPTAEGRLAVLYRDGEPRDMRLIQSADAGESWSSPSTVGDFHWAFTGCPHIGGALAQASGVGAALHSLAWTGAPNKQGLYYLRSADQGLTWTAPMRMGNKALHGDLAVMDTQVLAVWDDMQPDGSCIMMAESLNAGDSWQTNQVLSTAVQATHPRVVATRLGFLSLWTEKRSKSAAQLAFAFFAVPSL